LFRGKAKRALSHDVSAAVIRNRRGRTSAAPEVLALISTETGFRQITLAESAAKDCRETVCPASVLNRAAGQEEARHRDGFRNLPAAAIAHIQDDLADALFFGLQYAIAHFVRSSAIERRQAESKDIRIDFSR